MGLVYCMWRSLALCGNYVNSLIMDEGLLVKQYMNPYKFENLFILAHCHYIYVGFGIHFWSWIVSISSLDVFTFLIDELI